MKSILFSLSLLIFLFLFTPLSAAESPPSLNPKPLALNKGLHYIDWIIIAFYGVSTISLGWYFNRKQKDTSEYFVGSGQMNPVLIGVSLFATLHSTITYLSTPGEILGKVPVNLVKDLAIPFIFIFVGFVMLPVYIR